MARVTNETQAIVLHDAQGNVTANYTGEMIDTIRNTVAKNATDAELIMFLTVANKYDLDPFLKEIFFAKMGDGEDAQATIMTSRDGYRKIAMREPDFYKCQSMEVRQNDEFKMEMEFGEVKNIIHNFTHNDRGKVIGAYAVLKTKSGDSLVSYVTRDEYDTGKNAWSKYKSAMIRKVAENDVYKKFADINGISDFESMPSEFEEGVEELETGEPVEFIETEIMEE